MKFEVRRKLFHAACGAVVVPIIYLDRFPLLAAVMLLLGGTATSLVSRNHRLPVIGVFLDYFERDHEQEQFPGKGAIFLLAGVIAVVWLFPRQIALAAVAGSVSGDVLSHLVGKRYGRIDNPLNRNKDVEGFLAGVLGGTLLSSLFVPRFVAVVAVATGMLVESLRAELFSFKIDDNLTVPLTIAVVATGLLRKAEIIGLIG